MPPPPRPARGQVIETTECLALALASGLVHRREHGGAHAGSARPTTTKVLWPLYRWAERLSCYSSASFRRFTPGSALIVFPAKARRRPGAISAMGTGRSLSSGRPKAGPVGRCDKVVGVSVEPATLQ